MVEAHQSRVEMEAGGRDPDYAEALNNNTIIFESPATSACVIQLIEQSCPAQGKSSIHSPSQHCRLDHRIRDCTKQPEANQTPRDRSLYQLEALRRSASASLISTNFISGRLFSLCLSSQPLCQIQQSLTRLLPPRRRRSSASFILV